MEVHDKAVGVATISLCRFRPPPTQKEGSGNGVGGHMGSHCCVRLLQKKQESRFVAGGLCVSLSFLTQFFVAILRAKATLKSADQEALFGPWESICSASRSGHTGGRGGGITAL